jgi:hypothetical protein
MALAGLEPATRNRRSIFIVSLLASVVARTLLPADPD